MKKFALILLTVALSSAPTLTSVADIQAPPGARYNSVRKLSRAVANIVYGISEVPATWMKTNDEEGPSVSGSYGVIEGSKKSLVRLGFGAYEFVTFPFKTYKGSYRPPYRKNIWFDTMHGYSEMPPELGFESRFDYVRSQSY
jgi:putative exosortase-associated protein (TIGR04073 family)